MTIAQRSAEWYAVRRTGITSTDIPAILGISPWASEGDIARDKYDESEPVEETRRMRLGRALEQVVADEDELEHGVRLRRVRRFIVSRDIPWAMTSLDFERVGEKAIVEIKTTSSRSWADGLPENIEAQVRWQMGVAGYPRAHIAALRFGNELLCYDLEHDQAIFEGLVLIADDFRQRLDAGGPFNESRESGRRAWPRDDGTVIEADAAVVQAVAELLETRHAQKILDEREDALVAALQMRIATASQVDGPGWRITWKQAKDREVVNYKSIAEGLLATLSEEDRLALVGIHTNTTPGSRPFVLRERER